MGLNIKNPRVHDLAKEAARITGKSQTGAIEEALEGLLRAYGADPAEARVAEKIDAVNGLVVDYLADAGDDNREITTVDDLYEGTTGLPR